MFKDKRKSICDIAKVSIKYFPEHINNIWSSYFSFLFFYLFIFLINFSFVFFFYSNTKWKYNGLTIQRELIIIIIAHQPTSIILMRARKVTKEHWHFAIESIEPRLRINRRLRSYEGKLKLTLHNLPNISFKRKTSPFL